MSVVYLETSALLRIVFDEPEAKRAETVLLQAERVVASRLLRIEAERALLRARLDHRGLEKHSPSIERELRTVWARTAFVDISREICDLAGRIAPASKLRSLDAIHLATFQVLKRLEPSAEMLTFDERLLSAL